MEFSTFGQKLYDVASSNMQKGQFCKMLFEKITDLKTADSDPLDLEFDTYRKYLRGSSITKLAKSINAYIETASFASYIKGHPEGVIINIAKAFQDELPDIDVEDYWTVADHMAALLEKIILEASKEYTPPN